jgi:dihydroflavonol-4-reductase
VTSSSAAVGPAQNGKPADETQWAAPHGGAYHDSKLLQERAAFAARIPVVSILPTAPVGPGDRKPTPTGKMIVDFARGAMFGRPPGDGGMNVVAVEDVARAHVVALERGRTGERYLVGGENLRFEELWQKLARATGRPAPSFHVPKALALAAAYVDEARSRIAHSAPSIPIEGVQMSTEPMYADSSKAVRELGHRPSDIDAALDRAVAWFRANGYV